MANKYSNYSKTKDTESFIPEAILDYHDQGPLREWDIEKQLNNFLEDSYNKGFIQVLVITGKGLNSQNGPVIRPQVTKILQKHSLVKSYKTATVSNGGEGALEVKLKT